MHTIWHSEITYLKRVGPQRAKVLAEECGIRTYGDLLGYYPRKYVDRSLVSKVHSLIGNEAQVTLVGKVVSIDYVKSKKGRGRLSAQFTDGSGFLELNWFQGIKWVQNKLKPGEEIALFGKPTRYGGSLQISHPEIDYLKNEAGVRQTGGIVAFYPSSEKLARVGLDSKGFRAIMHQLFEEAGHYIGENLNPEIPASYRLISHKEALFNIHFPQNNTAVQAALRRLKFEEFFFFQLMLARKRKVSKTQNTAPPFPKIGTYFNTFYDKHIPFELTGAQKRVLKEIRKDLGQGIQMNRLIQGDVGSGKTMVAFMSILIALDNGHQAAMMAPTAILAEQHYKKLQVMAEPLGLTVDIIVGNQKKKRRAELLEKLEMGETDIIVGTHALIEDTVKFQKLGLVVVDEQHKFGVMQRAKLWKKGNPFPHNMIMTATPIQGHWR